MVRRGILQQGFRRDDRDVGTRGVAALLERAAVGDEVEQVGADTKELQQRAALGGGAVAGETPALPP